MDVNELRNKSIKSTKWQSASAVISIGLNFVFILVLAFFFTPKDLGIIAIITIILSYTTKITNMGFSQAIIQRTEVTTNDRNNIFTFTQLLGIIAFVFLFFTSSLFAKLLNEPSLDNIIKIISVLLLLVPINSLFQTILKKEIEYDTLVKVNLSAFVIQKILILVFAYLGFGVYGYSLGMVLGTIFGVFIYLYIFIKNNIWIPKFYFNYNELKSYFSFGLYTTAQSLITNTFNYLDEIIISSIYGLELLGIYYFAKNIMNNLVRLLDKTIPQVMFPILSKLKDEPKMFIKLIVLMNKIMIIIIFPVSIGLAITAQYYIPILFSESWITSIDYFPFFSVWAISRMLSMIMIGPILALGKAKFIFHISLIELPIRIIILLLSAIYLNIYLFVLVLAVFELTKYFIYSIKMKKDIDYDINSSLFLIIKIVIISIISFSGSELLNGLLIEEYSDAKLLLLIVTIISYALIYITQILLFEMKTIKYLFSLARK